MVATEIIPTEEAIAEYHEPGEAIDPDQLAQHYDLRERIGNAEAGK